MLKKQIKSGCSPFWIWLLGGILLTGAVVWLGEKKLQEHYIQQAEELMSSVREEQEQYCVFHKRYMQDLKEFPGLFPVSEDKRFRYVFKPTGMEAHRKGRRKYILKMPSYEDGRICCEGHHCRKLKRGYPSCADLTARADYAVGTECAPRREKPRCKGPAVRSCGCQGKGRQIRICDLQTHQWKEWGKCSIAESCDCAAVSGIQPADQTQVCNGCGVQSRRYICDTASGTWQAGEWSPCSRRPEECAPARLGK